MPAERKAAAGRIGMWAWAIVFLVCVVSLSRGVRTTSGLAWPHDDDLYRDIAQAQTMADGGWLADPFYRGEGTWYNPLGPAVIALASRWAGIPAHEASMRLGPWLGLAAPLAFGAVAASLIGRWGAVAALVAFVFVTPGRLPALLCATYSPWAFGAQVAQGPFYLGLLAVAVAVRRPALWRFALAGALLGLTFLAHTAPALLLGAVGCTVTMTGPGVWPALRPRLTRLAVLLAAALAVASPFLWSIAVRYRLRVVNPAPGSWVWRGTGVESLGSILAAALDRPVVLGLTLLGLAAVVARRGPCATPRASRRIVVAWLLWDVSLLAYGLGKPALEGMGLPVLSLAPAFHFWLHLGAIVSLLVGCGVAWLGDLLASTRAAEPARRARRGAVATVALCLVLALASYATWHERGDFTEARLVAEFHSGRADRIAAHRWVRDHTMPDDVFLAEHDLGLRVVATAGRKLVAMDRNFSNPFVPWEPRAAAAERMLSLLGPAGHEAFHPLAVAYRVSYLIVEREGPGRPFPDVPFLTLVFRDRDVAVYRTGCWPE